MIEKTDESDAINETHDFHGFTAPPSVPGQAQSVAWRNEVDVWIAGQPKDKVTWLPLYLELMEEQGIKPQAEQWDWRKCLYVAWRCAPSKMRWPETIDELASFMGLRNTATIRHWRRKNPTLEQTISSLRVRLVDRHVSDLVQASIDCALNDAEKGFQDRRMLLEIAGVYKPKQELTGKDSGDIVIKVVYADKRIDSDTSDSAS